ncbi:transporter substrate-binding domain-containing protein [Allopusillimonas soli]|uniref:ABC transporter substrate-binding protein n=1 Tax=Allopusillimonas soli TaxID=659016 RepID=A0A853FDP5_9BURK|nr:ABC transporter substrate-binding protein [Allopusillimonas soli]NYT36960.1 ABC transporter substrate-binding protein [Allopusillimonas soli]TEA75409.1 transporter substrate-binding domain-containing protein [Allopusillimonas soli]
MKRRTFIQLAGASALAGAYPGLALAQEKVKIKAGYLHTLAVDGQIWLADSMGLWEKAGLDMEFVKFQTGLELFQAMSGGSIDVLATGAVMSNFPARGRGKVFLINDVEFATAQLWVHPDMGVNSIQDLKGKKISTTTGTTAHVFLDKALRANGLDPAKDVDIVNQRMPDAVTAFISKAVPAVALWVPFNISVKKRNPDAKMLVDASSFYPEAAIVGGWAARNDYYENNKDALKRIIKAWAQANDHMVNNAKESIELLQKKYYPNVPLSDIQEQYKAQKMFTSQDWVKLYEDGTVTKWLQQVTDFFIDFAKINNAVPASKYFDPSLYLDVVKS